MGRAASPPASRIRLRRPPAVFGFAENGAPRKCADCTATHKSASRFAASRDHYPKVISVNRRARVFLFDVAVICAERYGHPWVKRPRGTK